MPNNGRRSASNDSTDGFLDLIWWLSGNILRFRCQCRCWDNYNVPAFARPYKGTGPAPFQVEQEHQVIQNNDALGDSKPSPNDWANRTVIGVVAKANTIVRSQRDALPLGRKAKWLLRLISEQLAKIVRCVRTRRLREPDRHS